MDPRKTVPATYKAESPHFRLDIVASPDEARDGNAVANLVYLRWVLRAARAHSDAIGFDYAAYQELGATLTVRRHEIDYLTPAHAGDRLTLATWIESWRTTSCVRRTSIIRDDGVEVARALTVWGLVATETGQPHKVPEQLKEAFRRPPG